MSIYGVFIGFVAIKVLLFKPIQRYTKSKTT